MLGSTWLTALLTLGVMSTMMTTQTTRAFTPLVAALAPPTRGTTAAVVAATTPATVRFGTPSDADTTDERIAQSAATEQSPRPPVKCPNCDKCDGSGRIAGGIGALLPWWPIKAFRPCPNLIAGGGFYERSGQGLDEIAFGRDSTFEK